MRMTADELLANSPSDVAEIKATGLALNFRLKDNLQKEVSKLIAVVSDTRTAAVLLQGVKHVEDFMCLLEQVGP